MFSLISHSVPLELEKASLLLTELSRGGNAKHEIDVENTVGERDDAHDSFGQHLVRILKAFLPHLHCNHEDKQEGKEHGEMSQQVVGLIKVSPFISW